jgi:hypothetical protein
LNEELHVLITVEDTQNRAEMKLRNAVEEVRKLLVPMVRTGTVFQVLQSVFVYNDRLSLTGCV